MAEEQKLNETAGQIIDVPCLRCQVETKHAVLVSVDIEGHESEGPNTMDWRSTHQVIQCRGCETISFRTESTHSEDYDLGPDGMEYRKSEILYPNRSTGRLPRWDWLELPPSIDRIYSETIKAMNNDQPVLAGMGIRALVETICKDKDAPPGNLEQRVDSLIGLGVLTKEDAAILHKVRTLGNMAAHEVKPHTAEQLGLALNVCEHLLERVYILPPSAKRTFD